MNFQKYYPKNINYSGKFTTFIGYQILKKDVLYSLAVEGPIFQW